MPTYRPATITCGILLALTFVAAAYFPDEKPGHHIVRVTGPEARRPCEVSVAINPTNPDHVLAVSLQSGGRGGVGTTSFAYVSTDGGLSWKTVPAPNPTNRSLGDDAVTFGPDGTAYWIHLAFEGLRMPRPPRGSTGLWLSGSRDGLAWSDPVAVVDHVNSVEPFEDKPGIAVDGVPASPHKGNLYVAWTRFDVYGSKDPAHHSHIYFSRSKDGGKTFSVMHRISDTPGDCLDSDNTLMGALPAVGTGGEVYVVWGGPRGVVFDKSADGGWTFGKDVVISETPGGWDLPVKGLPRHNGLPVIGVDHSPGRDRGSIYVCWIDERHGDPDVFLSASRDGGATWSPPSRVNDDPKGNGKAQMFAWLAVDRVDGSVNTIFYDRRDPEETKTGLTLARSVDGGRTFVNHRLKQEPFDCDRIGFLGDYIGIDALGGRVIAVYPHPVEGKKLVLSAARFHFKPGTQEPSLK
jgi:hypothetical protein